MNCRPGDLAVVKNPRSMNFGRLVLVVRPIGEQECRTLGFCWDTDHAWLVEAVGAPLTCDYGGIYTYRPFADKALRPIRDPGDDATDEMVQLLGKPSEVTA